MFLNVAVMRFLIYIYLFGLFIAGAFFLRDTQQQSAAHRFTIVCTTTILADTIRNIVGEHAEVISLMGPGVDPHLYRPREGDVHRLAAADLVFYHGLHLEGKLANILESLDRYAPTYAVSDAIPRELLRSGNSDFSAHAEQDAQADPHIWHSVPLWIRVVGHIAECCAQHDPVHAEFYREHAKVYTAQLRELHEHIQDAIATIPPAQRILVTAHDAFGYFGATYGLEVVALQGISTEAEIGAWDVAHLVDFICTHQVPALFVETAIPHRTLQAVVDAVRVRNCIVKLGEELYADALGDSNSDAATYVKMIEHNVHVIVEGLT
jgi:manganese/zinc/iron transport system substrate-binding protein